MRLMPTITYSTPDHDMSAPLLTDADVLDRVGSCIDQQSRDARSLWLMFVDHDSIQLPVLVPIEGVPEHPDPADARAICKVISQVLRDAVPGGSTVIALARPGTGRLGESDRQWASALREAADEGTRIRMVCLATTTEVLRLDT